MELSKVTGAGFLNRIQYHAYVHSGTAVTIHCLHPESVLCAKISRYAEGYFVLLTVSKRLIIGNRLDCSKDITDILSGYGISSEIAMIGTLMNTVFLAISNQIFIIELTINNLEAKLVQVVKVDSDISIMNYAQGSILLVKTDTSLYHIQCTDDNWGLQCLNIPEAHLVNQIMGFAGYLWLRNTEGQICLYSYLQVLTDPHTIKVPGLDGICVTKMIKANPFVFFITDDCRCYISLFISNDISTSKTFCVVNYSIIGCYACDTLVFFYTSDNQIYVTRKSKIRERLINLPSGSCNLDLIHLAFLDDLGIREIKLMVDLYYFVTEEGRVYLGVPNLDTEPLSFTFSLAQVFEDNRVYYKPKRRIGSALSMIGSQ